MIAKSITAGGAAFEEAVRERVGNIAAVNVPGQESCDVRKVAQYILPMWSAANSAVAQVSLANCLRNQNAPQTRKRQTKIGKRKYSVAMAGVLNRGKFEPQSRIGQPKT